MQDKVAIVMAASKGLGRACASALAAEGARVTIGARGAQALEETAQEIQRATGSRVLAVPTDVTRAGDVEAIVAATVREFGRIDILVSNAGGPPAGKFESFGDAQWQAAFELNLLSTVRLVRLVVPHMRKTGSGRIITIVSTSVKQPIDGLLLSNAIRSGVVGLAKTLSVELAPDNITVNNVITAPSAQAIFNACYDLASLNNPFCGAFQRAPAGPIDPTTGVGAPTGPRGEPAYSLLLAISTILPKGCSRE